MQGLSFDRAFDEDAAPRMSTDRMTIALLYALFAVIATATNIGAQELSIRLYDGAHGVVLAMGVGTGFGLIVKYWLDKRYIFRFRTRSLAHDGGTFMLYTAVGVLTTAVFWGFEWGFHLIFDDKTWRYVGGVIGLAIGYVIKYQLDKRYVFVEARA